MDVWSIITRRKTLNYPEKLYHIMNRRTILIISLSALCLLIALLIHLFTQKEGFEFGIINDEFLSGFFFGLGVTFPILLIRKPEDE
jgi:hypothetical protein